MREERSAGRALARSWFEEVVAPTMAIAFPGLRYAAGRLGTGSDVLGLDDATSRDHDWGLRLTLLVPGSAVDDVRRALAADLPDSFRGMPTRFPGTGETVPRQHIDVSSLADFLLARTGVDPRTGMTSEDWLSLSGQSVLEVVAGPVFADHDGELARVRAALAWYPDDLWRYVLACDWARIAQELPLMSRAAEVGDDRGARLIAGRLAHVTMHLAFLLERRWPPYAKWFGTVFRALPCASALGPRIDLLLTGADDRTRQQGAAEALQLLSDFQRGLGLTDVRRAAIPFWDRPHLHPDPAIAAQLLSTISDPLVRGLPLGLGSVEQRTENVDVLVDPARRRALVAVR